VCVYTHIYTPTHTHCQEKQWTLPLMHKIIS
jgi:hypothetical protein